MTAARTAAFLDTSYVVRYLVNDPPDMAEKAAQVIDSDETLILSELAILEAAYVLTSVYSVPREEVVDSLGELIQRANLRLPNLPKARALEALRLCRNSGRVSFADAMIWAQAVEMGAARIYTFDRRFPAHEITIEGM